MLLATVLSTFLTFLSFIFRLDEAFVCGQVHIIQTRRTFTMVALVVRVILIAAMVHGAFAAQKTALRGTTNRVMCGVGRLTTVIPGLMVLKTDGTIELAVSGVTFEMIGQGVCLTVGDVIVATVL